MKNQNNKPYTGVFPIVPTPFTEDGSFDLEGQKRVIDCMVDQGNDGLCLLANYSEQFLLTDGERDQIMDVCLKQVDSRLPIIVTISHFSTRIAVERAKKAESLGADMLMLMPPYHGAVKMAGEKQVYEHFERVANSVQIPIMLQDAPLSGVDLSVEFLAKLATGISNLNYFKIESKGAASKLRSLVDIAGDHIEGPFDGEEAITLMADLDAGATGNMTSGLLPDLIRKVVTSHLNGDRQTAFEEYNRLLPLINFENRQCGLVGTKTVMKEGGVIKSDYVRHPLTPLHPDTKEQLIELAKLFNPLALHWGK